MSNRKQRKEIDKAVRNIINFAEQQPEWPWFANREDNTNTLYILKER